MSEKPYKPVYVVFTIKVLYDLFKATLGIYSDLTDLPVDFFALTHQMDSLSHNGSI